uniref:SCP domain-containing protein n=1 Tax=Acrobeloides nanus TaxID=290746 RepID=A0A914CF69_9BILA
MASAKNMHKLVYDCNLEVVAQGWADGCRGLVHSDDSYRRAGENLFIIFGKGYNMRLEKALEWGIRVWFEELDEIGMNSNDTTFTKELHESGMGHFTQLAWGKTTHVGCGLTLCEKNDTMLISCNYRQ